MNSCQTKWILVTFFLNLFNQTIYRDDVKGGCVVAVCLRIKCEYLPCKCLIMDQFLSHSLADDYNYASCG